MVPAAELKRGLEAIGEAASDFVFTTPERLTTPDFLARLKAGTIDFVVIDEAHCISQWGHDFRPAFLGLRQALSELGDPPVLALTATATPDVAEDIRQRLGRPEMRIMNTSIHRPNLLLEVERITGDGEKENELLRLLADTDGPAIVYTATVRHAVLVSTFLAREGIDVGLYHGKLAAKRRGRAQERFMAGRDRVIVATNAFGMGIDKPDIRMVIHYDLPASIEAYYQEAGRAGRDGNPARCVLLYDGADHRVHRFLMAGRYPGLEDFESVLDGLDREATKAGASVRLTQIQAATRVSRDKVRVALNTLKEYGLVTERRASSFALRDGRPSREALLGLAQGYRDRADSDQRRLEQMDAYGKSARCRWNILLTYFGEPTREEPCGQCDNCFAPLAERIQETDSLASQLGLPGTHRFDVGDAVELPVHGAGTVTRVQSKTLEVEFPDGKSGKFRKEFARRVSSVT
jgi:ATP-dependent DNA helicase RecQ